MEKMPFQPEMTRQATMAAPGAAVSGPATRRGDVTTSDWRQGLPVLTSSRITLRELHVDDAASLFSMLSTEEAARFISPPPTSVDGFKRFIEWTISERRNGNYVCFAVVPEGMSTAVGIFQVRALDPTFGVAEWGFAIGSAFWGSGAFVAGARLVLEFVFDTVGVHRIEARASIANGRGNGALRKLGAVQEGVLRRSFLRNGEYHDQVMWSLLAEDWRTQSAEFRPRVH
jgi:RimJ/RimL family protein N-acetyltransferase